MQRFQMFGREFLLVEGRVFVAVEDDLPPTTRKAARAPLRLSAGKAKSRRGMGPEPMAALRRPAQCGKGCGRVFTWAPGRQSHERHCVKARRK